MSDQGPPCLSRTRQKNAGSCVATKLAVIKHRLSIPGPVRSGSKQQRPRGTKRPALYAHISAHPWLGFQPQGTVTDMGLSPAWPLLWLTAYVAASTGGHEPQQIHLAFGQGDGDIVLSWSTQTQTASSCVSYQAEPAAPQQLACGSSELFTDGGPKRLQQYLHSATLQGLLPGSLYTYTVGSHGQAWSQELSFVSKRQGAAAFEQRPLSLLVYGDMGLDRALVRAQSACSKYTGRAREQGA